MMHFVKATRRGYVEWQGWQCAESARQAIEFAQMYHATIRKSRWSTVTP
jgi:hypothetical protein